MSLHDFAPFFGSFQFVFHQHIGLLISAASAVLLMVPPVTGDAKVFEVLILPVSELAVQSTPERLAISRSIALNIFSFCLITNML